MHTFAVKIALKIFCAFLILLIIVGNIRNSYNSKKQYFFFLNMLLATFLMLVFDVLSKTSTIVLLGAVFKSFSYIFYFLTITLFSFYITAYIREKTDFSYFLAKMTVPVCAIFALGWSLSAFNEIFFLVRKDLHRFIYWVGQLGGTVVISICFVIIFKNRKVLKIYDNLFFLLFSIFPASAFFLRHLVYFFSIDISLAVSELLIYIFINVKKTQELSEQQLLISKYKASAMYSQIRPHFIFNVLNSIYVMCAKDSRLAQNAIEKFSDYLRSNIEFIEKDEKISIGQEMNLVKNYVALEKLRFADELKVEYDIQADDFFIPPFTLQPLVENAVKHGLLPKKGGGTIKIKTYKNAGFNVIDIYDDGVGFVKGGAYNSEHKEKEGSHIGIENVNDRLKILCGGCVEIGSIERWTVVRIKIPVFSSEKTEGNK